MKINQFGRSMIEMLGVLAIIGVLSVGAIAGYQKAMMKYKLNKQAQQLSQILNATTRYAHSFNNLTKSEDFFTYLKKLGEIPKEMIKNNNQKNVYDAFNSEIYATIYPKNNTDSSWQGVIGMHITPQLTVKSHDNLAICKNIYTTLIEHQSDIYYTYSSSGYSTEDNRESNVLYGNNDCYDNRTCLKDITIDQIYQLCSLHIGNSAKGSIIVLWKMD